MTVMVVLVFLLSGMQTVWGRMAVVDDSFHDYALGAIDPETSYTGSGVVVSEGGDQCIFNDTGNFITKTLNTPIEGDFVVNLNFMQKTKNYSYVLHILGGGKSMITVQTSGDNIISWGPGLTFNPVIVPNYQTDVWYNLSVAVDREAKTVDFMVNGVTVQSDVVFYDETVGAIEQLQFMADQGDLYIDDVYVLPTEYPAFEGNLRYAQLLTRDAAYGDAAGMYPLSSQMMLEDLVTEIESEVNAAGDALTAEQAEMLSARLENGLTMFRNTEILSGGKTTWFAEDFSQYNPANYLVNTGVTVMEENGNMVGNIKHSGDPNSRLLKDMQFSEFAPIDGEVEFSFRFKIPKSAENKFIDVFDMSDSATGNTHPVLMRYYGGNLYVMNGAEAKMLLTPEDNVTDVWHTVKGHVSVPDKQFELTLDDTIYTGVCSFQQEAYPAPDELNRIFSAWMMEEGAELFLDDILFTNASVASGIRVKADSEVTVPNSGQIAVVPVVEITDQYNQPMVCKQYSLSLEMPVGGVAVEDGRLLISSEAQPDTVVTVKVTADSGIYTRFSVTLKAQEGYAMSGVVENGKLHVKVTNVSAGEIEPSDLCVAYYDTQNHLCGVEVIKGVQSDTSVYDRQDIAIADDAVKVRLFLFDSIETLMPRLSSVDLTIS